MSTIDRLAEMGHHALGVSLDYREAGTHWPKRWRCRLVYTRNAADEMRMTAYGDTADEAVESLHGMWSGRRFTPP